MKIPILTYHSIDSTGSVISVTPAKFREHMQILKDRNTPVVSLRDVSGWIQGKNTIPENSVSITFDDGYSSFYREAFPVLRDFGFPATVFVVAGYCGAKNNWPGQSAGIPVLDLMTWQELSELPGHGIDIGSHTIHHPDFSRSSAEVALEEVQKSIDVIQQSAGTRPQFFAYPYGIRSKDSEEAVRKNFEGACSVVMDFTKQDSDRFFLPRIDMYYFSRNKYFSDFGATSFDLYVRARALLRSLKQGSY